MKLRGVQGPESVQDLRAGSVSSMGTVLTGVCVPSLLDWLLLVLLVVFTIDVFILVVMNSTWSRFKSRADLRGTARLDVATRLPSLSSSV